MDNINRKVREMADKLERLLDDQELLYRLLSDPTISHKLLFIIGALRIKVRFPLALSGFQDAS